MRRNWTLRGPRTAVLGAVAAVVAGVAIPMAMASSSAAGPEPAPLAADVGITVPSSPTPPRADPSPTSGTSAAGTTTADSSSASAATGTGATTGVSTSASTSTSGPASTAGPAGTPTTVVAEPPAAPAVTAGEASDGAQDAARLISVLDRGAVGDGVTDDTAAVQAAFDMASVGDIVYLPAGRTFVQSRVLTIRNPGVVVTGGGRLLATVESASSLTVAAPDVTVSDLTLAISSTSRRWDAYEQQRLRLAGATGAVIRGVVVDGSAAAGIYVGGGTSNFLLDGVTVKNTRADGIHITQGSHDGRVVSPVVRNVGDDGVAVVSYRQDGAPCARIQVVSPSVDGSTGGRGISVVGGTDVDYSGIDVRNTYGAGVYLAAEGGWGTTGVARVRITGGTIVNANYDTGIDHGSVLVYNGTGDQAVQDLTLTGLSVSGYRGSVSRVLGLITDSASSPGIRNASLSGISITGDGGPAALVVNQGTTTFDTSGLLRNGRALVRTGGYFR